MQESFAAKRKYSLRLSSPTSQAPHELQYRIRVFRLLAFGLDDPLVFEDRHPKAGHRFRFR